MAAPITVTPSVGDGSRVAFTLASVPVNPEVFVGGLLRRVTTDYAIAGTTLTLVVAPVLSEPVQVLADGATTTVASGLSYDTVANIVSDAAVELGLAAITDVYGDTTASTVQLRTLLKSIGQALIDEHDWTALVRQYTFSTAASTVSYALPADFARELSETRWNRTALWPLQAISPQGWQTVQAWTSTGLVYKQARLQGGTLKLTPTPTAAETIAYEYVSRYWVSATGGTSPNAEAPTANSDLLYFDRLLLVSALKLRFLEAKGFDTAAAEMAYRRRLSACRGSDNIDDTIYLGGPISDGLIGQWNIPDTGFGT